MVWKAWAGVASIVGGVLVAAAFGSAPAWGVYVILALVIASGATVLVSGVRERARGRRRPIRSTSTVVDVDEIEEDREMVREVCRIVSRKDIVWLSHHDFVAPWRGRQVEPWAELLRFHSRGHFPFDAELDRSYDGLIRATASFMDAYNSNTFSDQLLVADDWRDIGWSPADAALLHGEERKILEQRRAVLNERAADVVAEYASFLDTAWRAVGL